MSSDASKAKISGRDIDVGGYFLPVQYIGDGVDIYLSGDIFRDGAGVDQALWIAVVSVDFFCGHFAESGFRILFL